MNQVEEETQGLQRYWALRDKQMLEDRAIINLTKPPPVTDKIQWVSNEPKVFYETATALISSYPPRFRLPLTIDFNSDEKTKMNKAERFILGVFRNLDERQHQNYWLRELAYRILSGWYAVFVLVKRNGDEVDFIADVFDPITVYPEWDNDGLSQVSRTYEVDQRTAKVMATGFKSSGLVFEYKQPIETESKVKVINYWKRERVKVKGKIVNKVSNSILLNGQEVKPLTHEKRFKRIPIFVGAIGVPDYLSADWPTRFGENIIATNRDMNEYENKMVSLQATIMAETAYPNIVTQTKTGAPAIKSEGLKGYAEVIPLKIGDKIELLKHAATPAEVQVLHAWTRRRIQTGSFSDAVYGGMPDFEISGFALSQFLASLRYKIGPYWFMEQKLIGRIASEFLDQYKSGDEKGKFPKVSLSTTNPNELRKGLFFVEEFEPNDVPDSKFVEATIPITSALDKIQQMLFARQALAPPQLLSRETLWDEMLDVQDTEQEYARIIQDEMLSDPMVKQIAMIEQLRERKRMYEYKGLIAEANALNQYIMALEMQLGMRQGIPSGPGETGVPPGLSPPEMGNSPDSNRAAVGVGPPGLNRRPQSQEERDASKGRKGMLVSPTGEPL